MPCSLPSPFGSLLMWLLSHSFYCIALPHACCLLLFTCNSAPFVIALPECTFENEPRHRMRNTTLQHRETWVARCLQNFPAIMEWGYQPRWGHQQRFLVTVSVECSESRASIFNFVRVKQSPTSLEPTVKGRGFTLYNTSKNTTQRLLIAACGMWWLCNVRSTLTINICQIQVFTGL